MKLASLVSSAIAGLLFASPAAASACKPSKVASAASSSSATSSSSAAPSAPPTPPPCGVNILSNGDFSNSLNSWDVSGQVVYLGGSCLGSSLNCADLNAGLYQSTISQTLTNLQIGQGYTFSYGYSVQSFESDASFQCTITGVGADGTVSTASFPLPSQGNSYTGNFTPVSATSELSCTAASNTGGIDIYLFSMSVVRNCQVVE